MNKFNVIILFPLFFINSCFSNTVGSVGYKQDLGDTTKKIIDISLSGNSLLKGLIYLDVYDVYQDSLYLINNDKLLQIDLKSGNITTNLKLNLFLAQQKKLNKPPQYLLVNKGCFYISFFDELYCIQTTGEIKKLYTDNIFISRFERFGTNLLIADQDSIKIINEKGKAVTSLSFVDFGGNNGFIKKEGAICYQALTTDSVIEFKPTANLSILVKKFAPISLTKGIEEPFISYATSDYLIGFNYKKRNAIYVLRKDIKKNEIIKTIKLTALNYAPAPAEIQKEEGNPNFKIGFSNNTFYVIALAKGRLGISSFSL